jgi:hypothetical protein
MMPALGAGGRWFESGRPHISVSISIQMSRNCYTPPFQRCELEEKNPVMAAGIAHRHGTRLYWLIEFIDKNFHFLDILLVVAMLIIYVVNINTLNDHYRLYVHELPQSSRLPVLRLKKRQSSKHIIFFVSSFAMVLELL